jgi:hypothetical protein
MCCAAAGLVQPGTEKQAFAYHTWRVLWARSHCALPGDEASCRTTAEGLRNGYGGSGESEDDGRIDDDYNPPIMIDRRRKGGR